MGPNSYTVRKKASTHAAFCADDQRMQECRRFGQTFSADDDETNHSRKPFGRLP